MTDFNVDAVTYMCGSGACPGFPDQHHELDCPEDRVRLVKNGVMHANHALGAMNRREAVGLLTEAINELTEARDLWVITARQDGLSWSEIGAQLGMSKQAAYERHNPRVRAAAPEVTEPMF